MTEDKLREFRERMRLVQAAVAAGEIKLSPDGRVNMREFVAWAAAKGLTMPPEMRKFWGPA